jgi:DNA polymerase III subunit epsilon
MPALPHYLKEQVSLQAQQALDQNPVFLDTETTGLDKTAEIVEISILDIDGSVLFDSLVRPSKPIPPEVIRIHHITNDMVRGAPTWPVVWPTVRGVLTGRMIAIYNEEFDIRLMKQSHAAYRLPWRENFKTVDVMQLYARYNGEWDSVRGSYRYLSLEKAGLQSKIELPNSHRAKDDTLLTRALLLYMAGK